MTIPINEKDAETLLQEHLRGRGWNLADFSLLRKGYKEYLGGEEADYAFLLDNRVIAFVEAKRPGKAVEELSEAERADLRAVIERYGDLSHNSLLNRVYAEYPAYARNSRLRRSRGRGAGR